MAADHPRPGIHLRQVDLPGIHTRCIESQRAVLAELLDPALAPEAVDADSRGLAGFARRYGFRDKAPRIRLRMLDPARRRLPHVASLMMDHATLVRFQAQWSTDPKPCCPTCRA